VIVIVMALASRDRGVDAVPISASGGSTTTTTLAIDPPTLGTPRAFQHVSGTGLNNGRTRIERSLGCSAGGDADYWHFQAGAPLGPGVLTGPQSTLPGDLRLTADVHSAHHAVRATPEPIPGPTANSAFLLPDASHVGLANQRGTVKLRLAAGGCGGRTDLPPALDFDGTTASVDHDEEPATWEIVSSTGSYRAAQGGGVFDLTANVSPGADNPWSLFLDGNIRVLQPRLRVTVSRTYWGQDGVDYAKRELAVVYDVVNVGSGDAYGVLLNKATSPTPGATLLGIITSSGDHLLTTGNHALGPYPRKLGDLLSGERTTVTVKWQLPMPSGNPPCGAVILDCEIDTTLGFVVPDALDVAPPDASVTVRARAPHLPPPLEGGS
jgi:hypothetical protein